MNVCTSYLSLNLGIVLSVPPPSISFTTAADLVKKSDEKAPVIRATPASSPAGTKT